MSDVSKLSVYDFCIAWATAHTIDDVVAATGLTKANIRARAQHYRSKGIDLPQLAERKIVKVGGYDVDELNAAIKRYDIGYKQRGL